MNRVVASSLRSSLKWKSLLHIVSVTGQKECEYSLGSFISIRNRNLYLRHLRLKSSYNTENDFTVSVRDIMLNADYMGSIQYDYNKGKYTSSLKTKAKELNLYFSVLGNSYVVDLGKVFKDTVGITFRNIPRSDYCINVASLVGYSWCLLEDGRNALRLAFTHQVDKHGDKEAFVQCSYVYLVVNNDRSIEVKYYRVPSEYVYITNLKDGKYNLSLEKSDFAMYLSPIKGSSTYAKLTNIDGSGDTEWKST